MVSSSKLGILSSIRLIICSVSFSSISCFAICLGGLVEASCISNPWFLNSFLYLLMYPSSLILCLYIDCMDSICKPRPWPSRFVDSRYMGIMSILFFIAKDISFLTFGEATEFLEINTINNDELINAFSTSSCHLSPDGMPSSYHMLHLSLWNLSISGYTNSESSWE